MTGTPIGLLCLDTHFAKPPGHIRNLATLPFPVIKSVVRGTTIDEMLNRPSDEFFAPFIHAAKDLEQQCPVIAVLARLGIVDGAQDTNSCDQFIERWQIVRRRRGKDQFA